MSSTTLEERLEALEIKVDALQQRLDATKSGKDWASTFGMFADDPGFDEVIRLGREYREQQSEYDDE